MDDLKKERIALEVIKTLKSRFDNFPIDASDNRNAPFHEAFLEAFRIKIEKNVTNIPIFVSLASWMHGLNTTLGQSFFENVAHILCDGEKRKFTGLSLRKDQQSVISDIIASLKNKTRYPDLEKENKEIYANINGEQVDAPNFSADVYYEEEDKLVLIELKTVKPNSDVFKEQKTKFLNAKAALKNRYSKKNIEFYLGFPFDPLHNEKCGYNKERFFNYSVDFKKYIAKEEVLLADELWNFLSQEKDTMLNILGIINAIATPDFINKYEYIGNPQNIDIDNSKYIGILTEWFLLREVKVCSQYEMLKEKSNSERKLQRVLSQKIFNAQNDYNENRINALLDIF
jgi:hypothetical protein